MKDRNSAIKSDLEAAIKDKKALEAQIKSMSEGLNAQQQKIVEDASARLEAEKEANSKRLQITKNVTAELRKQLLEADASLNAAREETRNVNKRLVESQRALDDFKSRIGAKDSEIRSLSSEMESLRGDIQDRDASLESAQKRIMHLEQSASSLLEKEEAYEKLKTSEASLRKKSSVADAAVSKATADLAFLRKECKELRDGKDMAERELSSEKVRAAELNASMQTIKAENAANLAKLRAEEVKCTDLGNEVKSLREKLNAALRKQSAAALKAKKAAPSATPKPAPAMPPAADPKPAVAKKSTSKLAAFMSSSSTERPRKSSNHTLDEVVQAKEKSLAAQLILKKKQEAAEIAHKRVEIAEKTQKELPISKPKAAPVKKQSALQKRMALWEKKTKEHKDTMASNPFSGAGAGIDLKGGSVPKGNDYGKPKAGSKNRGQSSGCQKVGRQRDR